MTANDLRAEALQRVNELFALNPHLNGGLLLECWRDSITNDTPGKIAARLYIDDRVRFTGKRELLRVKDNLIRALRAL